MRTVGGTRPQAHRDVRSPRKAHTMNPLHLPSVTPEHNATRLKWHELVRKIVARPPKGAKPGFGSTQAAEFKSAGNKVAREGRMALLNAYGGLEEAYDTLNEIPADMLEQAVQNVAKHFGMEA